MSQHGHRTRKYKVGISRQKNNTLLQGRNLEQSQTLGWHLSALTRRVLQRMREKMASERWSGVEITTWQRNPRLGGAGVAHCASMIQTQIYCFLSLPGFCLHATFSFPILSALTFLNEASYAIVMVCTHLQRSVNVLNPDASIYRLPLVSMAGRAIRRSTCNCV